MRRMYEFRLDAGSTHGASAPVRRMALGVIGGCARALEADRKDSSADVHMPINASHGSFQSPDYYASEAPDRELVADFLGANQ